MRDIERLCMLDREPVFDRSPQRLELTRHCARVVSP
jgi:hypothetical protein